jgi:holin-like protein
MSSQSISTRVKRFVHRNGPLQVGLVLAFWLAGQSVVRLTGLPVPGGVVGMLTAAVRDEMAQRSEHATRR